MKIFHFLLFFIMTSSVWAIDYKEEAANFYHLKDSSEFILLKVKSYQQTADYTCGPAAAMSLLHYYNKLDEQQMNAITELKIAKEMGTSVAKGTSPKQMAIWLIKHGFKVQLGAHGTFNLLQKSLKQGTPVLVEWVDWGGHWAIVTGYHQAKKTTLFLADPSASEDDVPDFNGVIIFNADRFQSMWFDAQYFKPGHIVPGIYIIATPKEK